MKKLYFFTALESIFQYKKLLKDEPRYIDFSKWFDKSFEVELSGKAKIKENILNAVKANGFKVKKEEEIDSLTVIEAIRGKKIWSAIEPYGEYGKRLFFKAKYTFGDQIELKLSIKPWMEFFDSPEESGLSQNSEEKYYDDLVSADILNEISKKIFEGLSLPIPSEIKEFNINLAAKYIFLRTWVYPPLDIRKSSGIHLPSYEIPKWNWNAFILPEIWYIWNNVGPALGIIAGVGTVFVGPMLLAVNVSLFLKIFAVLFFGASRILSGKYANLMYFARHGMVPKGIQ